MISTLKRNDGFTLIELLIVLTILVALTLTGTYKYFNIVETNKQKIDISNANILAEAVNVAEATGQLDIDSKSTEVTYEDLKNVLSKELKPVSKLYSGESGDSAFIITATKTSNDLNVTVTANGKQLYPTLTSEETSGD